jgi:glycosyltransferase involved in cell wall biosynthesis
MAHIGIDARLTYYRVGGISTYIRRTIQTLESLDTSNRYTILHSRKASEDLSNVFARANLWTPAHHRLERLAMSWELRRHQLDILHSPDFIPPRSGAKRFVITVHDLTFLHYPQFITRESRRFYNNQIKTAVQQADKILSDSNSTKQDMVNMLGVPAEKITVHRLGVDERFSPLERDYIQPLLDELELPFGYILHVGTWEPRKNLIGLLKAYRALRSQLKDCPPIVLVGKKGWLFDQLKAEIDELGLDKHIIWHEKITDEQLPFVYNGASVCITASFYEGFGLPALEGMACGVIPIVSNRSSLPEVVGDVGLLVIPEDTDNIAQALYHALTDSAWRTEHRQRALARAQTFTWQACAEVVLNTYQSLA